MKILSIMPRRFCHVKRVCSEKLQLTVLYGQRLGNLHEYLIWSEMLSKNDRNPESRIRNQTLEKWGQNVK